MTGLPPPTLALLIPAYNAAWCLPRLLRSAAQQTIPFDEIWVYDDCSTDNTAEIAERYGARVLRGNVNVGCSAGRNTLARHVSTDWFHFHDADDELMPDFTSLAHQWIERDDKDVVLFDYEYRQNESGELLGVSRFDGSALEADARRYAILHQINPFCGLYRRSSFLAAGGFDEDPLVLYNEDSAFHIRMAFSGCRFSAEPQVSIINYRVGGSMSSANAVKCVIAQHEVMKKTWAGGEALPYAPEIADRLWGISSVLASLDAWEEARRAAILALSIAPPSDGAGRLWFRMLARSAPFGAVWLRENSIRLLRPGLRRGAAEATTL